jgi:hypothetical protein
MLAGDLLTFEEINAVFREETGNDFLLPMSWWLMLWLGRLVIWGYR